MIKEWSKGKFGLAQTRKPDTSKTAEKPSLEEAINVWENDHEKNPEGYRIVRGLDGKPVEIIIVKRGEEPEFAVVINGKREEQFSMDKKPLGQVFGTLMFKQFLREDVFDGWYELSGVQLLDAQGITRDNQGFVFGLPGQTPEEFKTTMV